MREKAEQGDKQFNKIYEMISTVSVEGLLRDQLDDEELLKSKFVEHNERIKAIVPPERLLVMELGDGWEKLCPFLGKDISEEEPYPCGNSSEEFVAMREGLKSGKNAKEAYELAVGNAKG